MSLILRSQLSIKPNSLLDESDIRATRIRTSDADGKLKENACSDSVSGTVPLDTCSHVAMTYDHDGDRQVHL